MKNPNVRIKETKLLSDNWYLLNKITFEYKNSHGEWSEQIREAYDRGNGAAILLYNKQKGSVILTRQFRLPAYINGHKDGMMIEVCAGLLDEDNPEDCIKREAEEETGFKIKKVEKIFQAYMSPGAVTEILHFFVAEYDESMKVSEGGGLEEEQENIEVLELPFTEAWDLVQNGEICDAKTIMLLQHAKLNELI